MGCKGPDVGKGSVLPVVGLPRENEDELSAETTLAPTRPQQGHTLDMVRQEGNVQTSNL